ncbi:MAG: hypothetical protein LW832_03310, partial [Parachlamydia sp.]|nr:hypothetical protein [Parachlamydia sp.]
MAYKILFALVAMIALSGVSYIIYKKSYESHPHDEKDHSHEQHEDHDGKLRWTKEKIETADIDIQSAKSGSIQNVIRAPGRILIHPNHLAYIIPKVGGAVKI